MADIIKKEIGNTVIDQNDALLKKAVSAASEAVSDSKTQGTTSGHVSPYTTLPGLSANTQMQLGKYNQGYKPSDAVQNAQNYLDNIVSGNPGDYQSQYKQQLDDLYNQIMNREKFTYDLNGDMLYNQYKQMYQQQGQKAMMDTMGQAAALTGGYGSSYATTAGQQAYQDYLTQLNNIVPDLYEKAYSRYNQEGENLLNKYNVTQNLESDAYSKYRDTVSDWNSERDYASNDYWNRYNSEYTNYQNMLNYYNTLAQQENSQYLADREMAYSQAMAIIQTGKMPSSDLLQKAEISNADAKSLVAAYKKSSSGSGGGGSRRSSGGSGGSGGSAGISASNTLQDWSTAAKALQSHLAGATNMSYSDKVAIVNNAVGKTITESDARRIISYLVK